MKSGDLSKLLNLPASTLHKYSRDFADYLSPAGAGHREYTEHDARVLRYVIDMKAQRVPARDIEATLSSLRAGDWERLPALSEADQSIIPAQSTMIALQVDKSALQREIEVLQRDHEREVNMLRDMLKDERADRDELLRRLHRAEHQLELYQQGKLKPE